VYGLTVDESYTHLVTPDFPIRLLSLSTSGGQGKLSAAYWLQSINQTTDDYATRIWADLSPHRQRWILVTILYDQAVDPSSPESQAFYQTVHAVVLDGLDRGVLP
jgi:hypothetical protein